MSGWKMLRSKWLLPQITVSWRFRDLFVIDHWICWLGEDMACVFYSIPYLGEPPLSSSPFDKKKNNKGGWGEGLVSTQPCIQVRPESGDSASREPMTDEQVDKPATSPIHT